MDGAEGNDRLKGGAGASALCGGGGDDLLIGGNGRSVMIGDRGSGRLVGGSGDDILIGGITVYGRDQEALCEILDAWNRSDLAYNERIKRQSSSGYG